MKTVFTSPSISEYTDGAILYGLVECLIRGAPDSLLEIYSRGTVYEVLCDLDPDAFEIALQNGLRDALDELVERITAAQGLSWVYTAASGGLQPKRGDVLSTVGHLKEVLKKLSSGNTQEFKKFLDAALQRSHRCKGKWTSLALVPEWGRQEKGFFASPSRSSKLCEWCYTLSWVGLHNFALFARHEGHRDVSCTAALMIPGPSEKPYNRADLLAVRELGTKYQGERPLQAPPAPYAFLLWVLSRGETLLPLELSGRSFLASVVRFDRTGRPPQYSVAIRTYQTAPVWRLLRFAAQAKRRTSDFYPLVNSLLRDGQGADADTVQQLAESILFADLDGLYRSMRTIRSIGKEIPPGVVDAAFDAFS